MRFSTKLFIKCCLFVLSAASVTSTASAAGWNLPKDSGHKDWSDYSEASPDIYPDGWSVTTLADFDGVEIQLRGSNGALLRWMDVEQIEIVSETRSALYITRGDTPNASAGIRNGHNTVLVNFAMFDMIDGEADLWAALLGHELAHLKLKHGESQAKKQIPMTVLKTVTAAVINNPLTNIASSTLLDSVTAKFSRDDERQADYMGVIWAIEADHDAYGAVELHRRMKELSPGHPLPFLSTHPSSPERIEKLEALASRLTK